MHPNWLRIVLVIVLILCSLAQDPYKILRIPKNAKTPQIRSAYKKLAKEW